VAELAAAGVASVLVPFPHAVDDHQTGNARFLSQTAGGAVLLPQSELTPEAPGGLIRQLPQRCWTWRRWPRGRSPTGRVAGRVRRRLARNV
jgi:UDP-N-acetylglucosamine:LPS N-acetylglucosamine transferase